MRGLLELPDFCIRGSTVAHCFRDLILKILQYSTVHSLARRSFLGRPGLREAHGGRRFFGRDFEFEDVHFEGKYYLEKVRARWPLSLITKLPIGWIGWAPDSEEDGRIEGKEGVWGYVVPVGGAQPAAVDGGGDEGQAALAVDEE